ncbi:hypothetical protein GCM10028805_15930 [Spirosoma harenae]
MEDETYSMLVSWANSQIDHYVMAGYILKEVIQPQSGQLKLILAEYHEKEPIAEVTISGENDVFQGQFDLLADKEGPGPLKPDINTSNLDALLGWLRTGHDPGGTGTVS